MRRKRLHRILGLIRFLICSGVRCRYLASMVLGRALRRLPDDFRRRYGYRPAPGGTSEDLGGVVPSHTYVRSLRAERLLRTASG